MEIPNEDLCKTQENSEHNYDIEKYIPTNTNKKTLVLDLDETLIHSSFTQPIYFDFAIDLSFGEHIVPVYVQKRPGFDHFFSNVLFAFEVFIFTASIMEYAIPVIEKLIPGFPLSRVLTRQHCKIINGIVVKDLAIFSTDLNNIILVDNSPESFMLQPSNGIQITSWIGDCFDTELMNVIMPILNLCNKEKDVRNVLGSYEK